MALSLRWLSEENLAQASSSPTSSTPRTPPRTALAPDSASPSSSSACVPLSRSQFSLRVADVLASQFYVKQRTDHASDYPLDPSSPGDETGLNGSAGPSELDSQRWTWWSGFDDTPVASATATASAAVGGVFGSLPTQVTGALGHVLDASDPQATPTGMGMPSLQGDGLSVEEMGRMSEAANEWFAFALVTVGVSLAALVR